RGEPVAVVPPPAPMPAPIEAKPPSPAVALAAPPPAPGAAGSPGEPAASITAAPAPSRDSGDHTNLRPYAWGVGIAAGAALVFGAVEGVVAIKKRNDFNNHMGPDPNNP